MAQAVIMAAEACYYYITGNELDTWVDGVIHGSLPRANESIEPDGER